MSNNIETPEFWEQVKDDFENSGENYLCHASKIFENEWLNEFSELKIRAYVREVLKVRKDWRNIFMVVHWIPNPS